MKLYNMLQEMKKEAKESYNKNCNYEIAVTFCKAIELFIKDQENNKLNYYEIEMSPPNASNIDSYVICTTQINNNLGLQIKSGNFSLSKTKKQIFYNQHNIRLKCKNYSVVSWRYIHSRRDFDYNEEADKVIKSDNIQSIIKYLETKKDKYKKEYEFLMMIIEYILKNNRKGISVDWELLKKWQNKALNKKEVEEEYFENYYECLI